jgi:hypothetical protein
VGERTRSTVPDETTRNWRGGRPREVWKLLPVAGVEWAPGYAASKINERFGLLGYFKIPFGTGKVSGGVRGARWSSVRVCTFLLYTCIL